MPRKARVVIKGIPYHIVQRGNYRQRVFDSPEDNYYYIKCFQKYRAQFKVKVFSWCLMDNHVHFILEPSTEDSLGLLFKYLNVKYSHYINSKRMTRGQLWGGRFFSSALDEEHLYEAIRYVELNPIRAKMENQIGEYEWTSFQERTRKRNKFFLNELPEYIQINNWKEYVLEGLVDKEELYSEIRKYTYKNLPIGDEEFIKQFSNKSGFDMKAKDRGRPKRLV